MSVSVSKRMASVKPSPTSALLARVTELRAEGRDIIGLGAGEPDFDTIRAVKDAAIAAISIGETKYTPIDGTAILKKAVQKKFARENGLKYELSEIVVSNGAKQALFNLCFALLNPGDEAIVPAPYWVSYPDMVRLTGATPVIVDAGIEEDFKLSPAKLEAALTDKTHLLMLNSPNNPTGACYSRAELAALGEVLERYPQVVIASDEIYEHIHWAEDPFTSFAAACPGLKDRTITANGVSKAYAMTGWRIGYAAGPVALINAMKTLQSQCTSNPCSISQMAAGTALDGDQAPVREMTAAYRERHDYIVGAFNDIDGVECRAGEGTFYAFPKVTGLLHARGMSSDVDLAEFLIEKANVALMPGSAFGAPGYLRLSFASSMETLEEAISRINRALSA